MNETRWNFDEAAVLSAYELTVPTTSNADAMLFELDGFSITDTNVTGMPPLPWPLSATGKASTLFELFDESSHSEIIAAIARSKMTTIVTTTVRKISGQPAQLTMLTFGPDAPVAVALQNSTEVLPLAENSDRGTIRTRILCDYDGKVIRTEGPRGSYANTGIELGVWAERLINSDHRNEFRAALQTVLDGEPYASLQLPGAAPSLHFTVTIAHFNDSVLIDLYDHSHRVAAISALTRSQQQFNQLSETLPVGVFVCGAEGRLKFASERLQEMLGPQVATEFGWLECIHPDDRDIAGNAFAELPDTRHFNLEIRLEFAHGGYSWSRWAGSDVRDADGRLEYVVGFVEDISEWRELNSQIAYQAAFDGLTGLPNRNTLVEELRCRLETQKPLLMTGVLFIDLDGFKLINDTQGHSVGDIVLLEVAQRFRRALRPSDLIGRFGGDEFVVVASDISDPEEAKAIGRRLHDILSTPVLADGRIITVNASVGIALSEHEASSSEQLIGDADIAMYEAKASGRNRTVVFDATLRARASQRFDMTADLRHARRRRELRLEYQPIIDLHTDEMVGAEALVRWEHPAMGRISPAVFIPLAEEIGLIDDIGEWVVEQACADLDRLRGHQLVGEGFTISVNASAQQFKNVAVLATSSLASLDQFGLKPSNLRFELTESVPLTQIPDAANRIRQLTNYGFGLAIDDFGTGYSSLGYLTMLPFDVLKLDLTLTAQLEPGSPALAVVDSLTRMATEMNFEIVAEGIETDKQRALLTDAGVKLGQGYYLSRPLQLSRLIDLLDNAAIARS